MYAVGEFRLRAARTYGGENGERGAVGLCTHVPLVREDVIIRDAQSLLDFFRIEIFWVSSNGARV